LHHDMEGAIWLEQGHQSRRLVGIHPNWSEHPLARRGDNDDFHIPCVSINSRDKHVGLLVGSALRILAEPLDASNLRGQRFIRSVSVGSVSPVTTDPTGQSGLPQKSAPQ